MRIFFTICFTFYKLNNNNNDIDNDRFALHSMHHVRHGVVCITLHLIQRIFSPAKLSCFIRKLTFSQNLNLIFLKGNAVDEWGKHRLHTQNQTFAMCCCLLLRSSSFWFERLVEWACRDEGVDFAMGHCRKYKSSRGADGCCHVWENSSNFQRVHFVKIFRTSRIRAVLKLTRTHSSLVEVRHSCAQKI